MSFLNSLSINKEGIKIYSRAFKMSSIESLQAEAYDPLLVLKNNELGLRLLYRLRSNTTYTESTESLNTVDDIEDKNYEENE